MISLAEILTLLQAGGNTALLVCVVFIWRAERRFSRIEIMLELTLMDRGINPENIMPHHLRKRVYRQPSHETR